jgi:hypothetical protein
MTVILSILLVVVTLTLVVYIARDRNHLRVIARLSKFKPDIHRTVTVSMNDGERFVTYLIGDPLRSPGLLVAFQAIPDAKGVAYELYSRSGGHSIGIFQKQSQVQS